MTLRHSAARSTTPRPSAPSAASPSPLSQRTHSSNPRLLVLQDLLEDLNIAEMTIRRLQGELEQRDAALYAREADLQQLREEKGELQRTLGPRVELITHV